MNDDIFSPRLLPRLGVQDLEQQEPRELEGTVGAREPFWSPGNDWIGFAVGRELKKIPVAGGPATVLCQMPLDAPYRRRNEAR